MEIFFVAQKG